MSDNAHTQAQFAEIQRSLGRIEGTVTAINDDIKTRVAEHDDLEERVRKIEARQSYAAGQGAVVGSLAGGVVGFLSSFVSRFMPS
jgi:hypothetical protein